jgi:hypothetical protein
MRFLRLSALAVGLAIGGTFTSLACAQDEAVTEPPPAPTHAEETVTQRGGPSRVALAGGVVTLGVTYGAGALVAATSDRDADHRMLVPVAGPWMALFNRGNCGGMTGRYCDMEMTGKVLIIADGIGQALGAAMIIGAFLNPEILTTPQVVKAEKPSVHLTPVSFGRDGYGMLARGTF